MAGRRPTHQRIVVALAALVVMALVVVAPVHLADGALVVGAPCADAAPAQATVNVGVVVDFGVLADAADPASQVVTCVPVPPRATGFDMVKAAGHTIRLDSSGLVCAIDGLPAEGCGERTATGYRYWAYFHGSGSAWSYSSIGPAGYRASDGAVEGWHFVEGAGNPTDPPPRRAPTNICPVAPPPTAAPTTPVPVVPTTPAPTTPVVTAAPGGAGGGGTGGGGASPATGGATGPPTTPGPGATPGATTADGAPDPAGAPDPMVATDTPPGSDGPHEGTAGGSVPGAGESDVTILAAAQTAPPSSSGGAPLATIAAVVVVAALGGAAAWRLRARSDAVG